MFCVSGSVVLSVWIVGSHERRGHKAQSTNVSCSGSSRKDVGCSSPVIVVVIHSPPALVVECNWKRRGAGCSDGGARRTAASPISPKIIRLTDCFYAALPPLEIAFPSIDRLRRWHDPSLRPRRFPGADRRSPGWVERELPGEIGEMESSRDELRKALCVPTQSMQPTAITLYLRTGLSVETIIYYVKSYSRYKNKEVKKIKHNRPIQYSAQFYKSKYKIQCRAKQE